MTARPLNSLYLRRAIITRLRADTDLLAIGDPTIGVDPAKPRIYGLRSPGKDLVWPFVRYGSPDELPLRKGTEVRVAIHAFSKTTFEDEVSAMLSAIAVSLEDAVLALSPSFKAYMRLVGAQTLPDRAEADAWHGVSTWNATIG